MPFSESKNTKPLEKLHKRLRHKVGSAIQDYNMIENNDVIMVCLSGGKDSYTLLDILMDLQTRAPISFKIFAVNLDQKQPGFPEEILPNYLAKKEVPFHILEKDTYSIVNELTPEGKTTCSLCSRLRRGHLYGFAESIGANKIALGHHRDDMVETLFLNMFFNSRLKSMPPKLLSDDKKNIIIRPLAYCKESDISQYAQLKNYPIIPCNLCGSQENLQRKKVKKMLSVWEQEYPGRSENIFRSLQNISPSQLADTSLFDFSELEKIQIQTSPVKLIDTTQL
jgi:tRNA 2-thiocytidine biosynthesis protein TtcA